MRKVAFARINRRTSDGSLGEPRPFSEDLKLLAGTRETRYMTGTREWIAADLEIQPGENYLTGTLGFKDRGVRLEFEEDAFSWIKAKRAPGVDADARNVVPFAVDLRDDRRWVAHALSGRINATTFSNGLQGALESAVAAAGGLPVNWDVDPVTAVVTAEEWIRQHPDIRLFSRVVKQPNPGRDLSDDLEQMRAIGAGRRLEEFTAPYKQGLRVFETGKELTDFMKEKLEGLELGNLEITLEARGPGQSYKFSSKRKADSTRIEDYGSDLELGISLVLSALSGYSAIRAGEDIEGRLTLE